LGELWNELSNELLNELSTELSEEPSKKLSNELPDELSEVLSTQLLAAGFDSVESFDDHYPPRIVGHVSLSLALFSRPPEQASGPLRPAGRGAGEGGSIYPASPIACDDEGSVPISSAELHVLVIGTDQMAIELVTSVGTNSFVVIHNYGRIVCLIHLPHHINRP
jgi:hypothetical protein